MDVSLPHHHSTFHILFHHMNHLIWTKSGGLLTQLPLTPNSLNSWSVITKKTFSDSLFFLLVLLSHSEKAESSSPSSLLKLSSNCLWPSRQAGSVPQVVSQQCQTLFFIFCSFWSSVCFFYFWWFKIDLGIGFCRCLKIYQVFGFFGDLLIRELVT